MRTNAFVITQPNTVELREVALTPPNAGDVTVRTAFTSISAGTERMLLAGRMPHPMLSLPVVPGYETVGQVVDAGPDAPHDLLGRWVYVGGARCYADLNPAWGGQAAMLHVDHTKAILLDGIEPRQGVLLALGATALHGVDLVVDQRQKTKDQSLTSDDQGSNDHQRHGVLSSSVLGLSSSPRLLILGQGPVGQLAARIAQARGAWVAVTESNPTRREHSQANLRIDADAPLLEALGGPVDAIIEATGSMDALAAALPALANNGTIVLLGYYGELKLPYMPLFLKQARLLTAREWGPGDLERTRDLIASGALRVNDLLTHHLPATNPTRAYALALDTPDCLKLLLEW